jgi:predicted phage terminase large subunit-like protein
VCITLLVHESKYYYVMDVMWGRFDFLKLKSRAIAHAQKHKPNKILIEDAALGQALVDELKGAALPAIAVRPEGDKRTRISIQSAKFENGQVFLPKSSVAACV